MPIQMIRFLCGNSPVLFRNLKNHCFPLDKLVVRKFSDEVEKAKRGPFEPGNVTIFEKIIKKEIPADIIYEDDLCMAFNDVNPQAPTHFLVIPKQKITMLEKSEESDKELLGHLLFTAAKLAKKNLHKGYRVEKHKGMTFSYFNRKPMKTKMRHTKDIHKRN